MDSKKAMLLLRWQGVTENLDEYERTLNSEHSSKLSKSIAKKRIPELKEILSDIQKKLAQF